MKPARRLVSFRPRRRRARVVIDALQMPAQFSGVGRRALELGSALARNPSPVPVEVRCPLDALPLLERAFPADTIFQTPIRSSRPRALRILYQQLVAPLFDCSSTAVICLGDQAPIWGRAKVVLVLHDVRRFAEPGSSGRLEGLFYRLLVPRSVRRADRLFTISRFSRGEILRLLGSELSPDVLSIHPQPRASPARDARQPRHLLAVGTLRPYKGAELTLEALALLRDADVPSLVWAGAAEGRGEELQEAARRLGVDDRVRFCGWVDDTCLDDLYEHAFATINPSSYEGYGLSVAEGLARGVATLASDIPPHREIAADAALYFTPGDARGLALAIRSVTEDSGLREELRRKARERSHVLGEMRPSYGDLVAAAAALVGPALHEAGPIPQCPA